MKKLKALVIGENCDDVFIYGNCIKLNVEAPTPVFVKTKEIITKGMGHNVKNNLEALGVNVTFETHVEKITKIRYVDINSNYILLRVDNDGKTKTKYKMKNDPSKFDFVIISDYCKGYLSQKDISNISNQSKLCFLDTKKEIEGWINDIHFLKINEKEYNNPAHKKDYIEKNIDKLIVTLGSRGSMYKNNIYPVNDVTVRDATGAGDTFISSFATHFTLNRSVEGAIKFANLCCTDVVSKKGVTQPDKSFAKLLHSKRFTE